MLTLHIIEEQDGDGFRDATVSIGILDPFPGTRLRIYDFGLRKLIELDASHVVAIAEGDPARVSFAPSLQVQHERMVANQGRVIPLKRKRRPVPTSFVSGYHNWARSAALYWRKRGVGTQPLLAAGVFSLSSIQTSIKSALRLFSMLTPHVIVDELPSRRELTRIVKTSGAGLDDPERGRPAWYLDYADYRHLIVEHMNYGMRDDPLRKLLSTMVEMPAGLGLAKLSFTLALVGNNLGCLDARILDYAFTPQSRKRFIRATRKANNRYSDRAYDAYRRAELKILEDSPFFDPRDPVALARAQWMLWESLGPGAEREHTHEELFRAVLEPAWAL